MSKQDLLTKNKLALMSAITDEITRLKLKQREVAELLNIKQPRVSDLTQKKTDKFSLDILVGYMATLGNDIEMNYDTESSRNRLKVKITKHKE